MDQRKSSFDTRRTITLVSLLSLMLLVLGFAANPVVLSLMGHSTGAMATVGKTGLSFFLALTLMGVLGSSVAGVLRMQAQKIQVLEWELAQIRNLRGS